MSIGAPVSGLALIAVLMVGCASAPAEPEAIDIEYRGDRKADLPGDAPCIWIRDERKRLAFYGAEVSSAEALDWLGTGIENRLRSRTRQTESVPEKGLLVSLLKGYVNPIQDSLSGVVVIKVSWGERVSVYRGQVVQTNWWGAEGEIGRTMSAALDDALLKINFPVTTSTCIAAANPSIE